MAFLRYLIFSFFLISCICGSYAQSNTQDETTKSSKKEKKPKKEKKEKKVKKPKKEKTTSTEPNNSGDDKNFGPVFDGASVSVSAGINTYFGDLADYKIFPQFKDIGKYTTSAFKLSVARDIKWGLGAKLNYQSGKLEGTRKTGKNSTTKSFENSFFDLSIQPRYLISDILFQKTEYSRFKIYAHVGIGLMWYRTKLFDTNTLNTKDYEGYIEVEGTESLAQKTLSDKVAKAKTLTIPYGLTVVYKLNQKIDLHLDFTQSTTSTDRLDAFDRSWTAKDKYDYIGIGLTYNFNRTADDAPKKRPKKDQIKKVDGDTSSQLDASNSPTTLPISSLPKKSKKGLFRRKNKKSNDDDQLLNIRLKLFETQLKLFEMQYLLGK